MASELDGPAKRLLAELVRRINSGQIVAGRPETYPGYGQIHAALDLEMQGETVGQSLKRQGLATLAEWSHSERHPAITGIIVDQQSFLPGGGYFELFGRKGADYQWWNNEVKKSLEYDWTPFVSGRKQPPSPTPNAADLGPPPERVEITEYRILRDTALARRVKSLHDYRCQICGHSIELADGSFYAEGHHVRPLGKPHDGPDIEQNILCLCPNHHASVDLGAITIDIESISSAEGHTVDAKFINYHNAEIYRG